MKLYTFAPAANALRVEMFLREKNITLEKISVNVREDELFKEPFNSMNPFNYQKQFQFVATWMSNLKVQNYLETITKNKQLLICGIEE